MTEALQQFTIWDLGVWLLVASAVVVVAAAAVRLSMRTGLPSLVLYLLIGLVFSETQHGLPHDAMPFTRVLGYLALALILAEGGLTTNWDDIKPSVWPAALLSTVGVAVSIFVVAVAARWILHIEWPIALLLGAILASTDAAAVFSVLRAVPLPRRLTGILEAESGFNDAPVVLVVVALSAQAATHDGPSASLAHLLAMIVVELVGGVVIGVAVGWVGARVMRHLAHGHAGLFPIGVMAWVLLAYGVASIAHTSAFIATYLAGLVLANQHLPHRAAYRGFAQAMGWLAQIGLFVMLGMLTRPAELVSQLLPAIVIGLVLLLVARPASVFASVGWFGYSLREQLFLSWAGLRGAVPIVMATVPVIAGVGGIDWIFDLVFVMVIVFTLIQGPALPWVARALGMVGHDRTVELDVEVTPLEEMGAHLLHVRVGEHSRLHGLEVFELRLPQGAQVSLIVRDKNAFVPTPTTALHRGDEILIATAPGIRAGTERQLKAIDSGGRLAGWSPAVGKSILGRRPAPRGRHSDTN